jgi:hypothetical protein
MHRELTLTEVDAAIASTKGTPSPVPDRVFDVEDAVHVVHAAVGNRLDTLTDGNANELVMGELLGHDTLSLLSGEGGLDATNHSFVAVPEPAGLVLVSIGLACFIVAARCFAERRKPPGSRRST